MELSNSLFDSLLNSFGNLVQIVSSSTDENKKTKLAEQLNQFVEMVRPSVALSKRSNNFESQVPDKKIKLDVGTLDVPNEIWTKIMNHLSTNEIFHNFGLVSKRFLGLTSGMKHFHSKIIDENMSDTILKIVKNSRAIIALSFDFVNDSYHENEFAETFINEALNSCQKLKVLRIEGNLEIKIKVIEILQKFGAQFEHLEFENITLKTEVLIEVSKLKYLKSLGLRGVKIMLPNGDIFRYIRFDTLTDIVQNLITFATQLEAIDFKFSSCYSNITKLYNQLIYEKKDTLKKVGVTNTVRIRSLCKRTSGNECDDSLEAINLCKNLEELSGYLHPHECQNMQSKLKRLFTVKVNYFHEFDMFSKMHQLHFNLEHIEIEIKTELFGLFSQIKFPALKYLMIKLVDQTNYGISLNHENLNNLIKNSSNLRAIRLKGKSIDMTTKFMLQTFETKGIIISVNDSYLEDFEMADYFYKNQKNYQLFERYKELKNFCRRQFSDFQR